MFTIPIFDQQLYAQKTLKNAHQNALWDAVIEVAAKIDPMTLRQESLVYIPSDGLKLIQAYGIRDEKVYALPCILRGNPKLLGYYRMLIGISAKRFYNKSTGLSLFMSMEGEGKLTSKQDAALNEFCKTMNVALADLFNRLTKENIDRDLTELPIMTLGVYVDGVWRNVIGSNAAAAVKETIKDILVGMGLDITSEDGRRTTFHFRDKGFILYESSDPDLAIEDCYKRKILCVEVKGGQDVANVHNRAGEAEKSHQKAVAAGWEDCWTVILWDSLTQDQQEKIRGEAQTTKKWYDINNIVAQSGLSYERFKEDLTKLINESPEYPPKE